MDKTEQSLFALGRQLSQDADAEGLGRAMNTYIGTERAEVLDGWFEGALEVAVEAYRKALRNVPYEHRNAVIMATADIARRFSR